ncbi:PEP-CTERM sorting domain-containing protein [bacterium]|nr:PEP-CTERM sorting domain-containing protein [bacterium]
MKKTVIGLVAFAAVAGSSFAVTTVNLNNREFPATADNGLTITDNAGNPLSGVNFGVGTFSGGFASAAEISANFTALTEATTTGVHFDQNVLVDPSPQDDSQVFVVFYGNIDGTAAADFASATEFIVIGGNNTFKMEDPVTQAAASPVQLQNSTVEYGTLTTADTSAIVGPFAGFTNGVTFGNVPEPSTALLSLVGLAFVARRRR